MRVLLRPLPVAEPDRLFAVATTFLDSDKRPDYQRRLRLSDLPRLLQRGRRRRRVDGRRPASPQPVTFRPAGDPEVALRQYVSGNVFATFGLQPALGRLLAPATT